MFDSAVARSEQDYISAIYIQNVWLNPQILRS
jgi:hypothetical protein